ncbi:ribosome maturation factor RimM [Hyphobacterium marinum]|uniref:Ribosome maturation factor RimM n=1 Tax=Hyphobacterium marinum TaxID=3116574 RepID=A0ABU7LVM4_9PROT|nr:ribosome maturation factor RimM [Hyphobacterium sp. Y6023]MEE2565608.1 ribosome maturation factor RimM [Hyphobacterium sp. Y6023]
MPADLVCIAAIKGAHGVKGEARVKSFTAKPEDCCAYGPWRDEAGNVLLTPLRCRKAGDDLVVAFRETLQREAVADMRGTKVYVRRTDLPEPDADEFYMTDLIGLSAGDEAGTDVGRVVAVQNFGAGDLLEIENTDGRFYLAFTRDTVPVVDITAGRVVIRLPEEDDDEADKPSAG